ncbi:MAG: hypothetical protein IT370_02755 [Deltaproteobacteria bacterium]|nr:hypothetical protein [Deltaproteobacteria bacterium]
MLRQFRCANPGVPWEVEVERHVQEDLIDWALEPLARSQDPRVLLVFDRQSGELVGVAAHERVHFRDGQRRYAATKLHVTAVALGWQGRRFETGQRASDVVMVAVMTDVSQRVPRRDARVYAIVHQENLRSIRLCQRHGLLEELSRPDPSYRRLVTTRRTAKPRAS